MDDGLHVVLGASGGAGGAITRALHESGLRVRAVSRGGSGDLPVGIEQTRADFTVPDGATAAVAGASVAYLAAQPPYHRWPQEFPAMLANVLRAAQAADAKLVMVDNLYAYGPVRGPMTPETPQSASDTKGRLRAALADQLLQAHREGRVRVAIGRASDYFGPGSPNSALTALAIEPGAAGRTMRWVGTLDAPHAAAYLPDIGKAYVQLGTSDAADGRIWILPHVPAVTGREFLELVNRALPAPQRTAVLSKTMLRLAAPFHRVSREMLGISYQWTDPYEVDDSAFREALQGAPATPLPEAVAATVDWYRSRGGGSA